ncbi:MAG: helix-turn-helix transcriptional regulator [Armatimonadetes bacterium]|nr:XRE family transcriptional regulator [Armatimonadota bacterium]NOG38296.1 helix-turn-helix transcriptional regulator [Armatimonadota bacterium]GIK32702.1 MAG: transcriptional regulator [Armatimonadota bacterium]
MSAEADARRVFGATVRARRIVLGISQEELAFQAGLHRTYVGAIERGERNVSLLNICRLAEALGCEPSSLLQDIRQSEEE